MNLLKGLFQGKSEKGGMRRTSPSASLKGYILWGLLLCFLHPLYASGEESWTLWKGDSQALGNVSVRSLEGRRMASILEAAVLLGISGESQKDALVLRSGSRRASFVPGDVMVFVNGEIFPLTAPIRREGNSWWAEVHGLLKVLDMVLHGSSPAPAPLTWKGGGTEKGLEKPSSISPVPPTSPKKTEEELSMEAMLEKWRKDFAPSAASREGGALRRLRWKEHSDKVRLVLDMAWEEFPQPQEGSGILTLSFGTSLPQDFPGMSSPYPGKVTSSRSSESSLIFRHSAGRVETFSLASPPRFVVDFFFDVPASQKALPTLTPPAPKESPLLGEIIPEITSSAPKRAKPLVVVDPGHGGKDPGAVANGLKEKDLNLSISKYLAAELQKKGYTVLLTRQDDRYLRLRERTDFANRHKADAFISVHVNALPKGRHAKGIEIYIMALPSDKDAMELAKIENREICESNGGGSAAASDARTEMLLHILGDMQQNAKIAESTTFAEVLFQKGKATGLPMRRVAQAPFFVLRGAGMPSVLLETGFLTEKSEAKMLANTAYQRKIAQAFAEGVVRFLRDMQEIWRGFLVRFPGDNLELCEKGMFFRRWCGMAVQDFHEQEEQVRETREFRRSGRSEEREPRKRRIPLAIRMLVWLGLLGIFFGVGYFVAGAGLRFLNRLGVGAQSNVLADSEEAQRFMASSQEEISVQRKEYAAYVLENGTLVRKNMRIAPGVIEEDIVTVLEKVLEPLRVASGIQQPLRVLHVFRAGDMLYIDMNGAFVSALKVLDSQNAALIMTGLLRSMVENFSPAEQVLFFVDGKLSKITDPLDLTVPWTLAPAS